MLTVDRDCGRPFEDDVEVAPEAPLLDDRLAGCGLAERRLLSDQRRLARLELCEEGQRPQRRQVGLRQARPAADDRRVALVLRSLRLGLGGLQEGQHLLDVLGAARVVEDAEP